MRNDGSSRTRFGRPQVLFLALCSSLVAAGATAQPAENERLPGRLTTRVSEAFPEPRSVSLQMICTDQYAQQVRETITNELRAKGWTVDERSDLILRISISPCETDLAVKPTEPRRMERMDLPQSSAETGAKGQPVSQLRIPLGKTSAHQSRLSLVMQLFKSGGSPSWAAEISIDRHLRERSLQLKHLAMIGMEAFGKSDQRYFSGQ